MKDKIVAVDLFCGVGGLTHGLNLQGIDVCSGFDVDPESAFPYEANNRATFHQKDVREVTGNNITSAWKNKGSYTLLAGCAPCQPFSNYTHGRSDKDGKWSLLNEFSRLIIESSPDFVTMENVPSLIKKSIFNDFISTLESEGYSVSYSIVNCADYGIPQSRKRLVLLASKHGEIEIINKTHTTPTTVKDAISHLPRLRAGEKDPLDPLHIASSLSEINLQRIKHSKPGGSWRDWPSELQLACHKKASGERYGSVYGRMKWDAPSPTMTTLCNGYGNGRFGHPESDRAISLREAAIFQTFPENYQFFKGDIPSIKTIGRLIGNAVPVRLGEVIAKSFKQHLQLLP